MLDTTAPAGGVTVGQQPNGTPSPLPILQAKNVQIHYWVERERKAFLAVENFNLDISEGEFLVIVGPSGCGKTTFLDAVGGLHAISSGSLTLRGTPIKGPGPERAIVFQQPSLFPWKTVKANIAYGLEISGKATKANIQSRVAENVSLVGLSGFENSFPSELSGGMQQRANLARALTADPDILLLDEPFGALDAQTRDTMQAELLRIWNVKRKTALFITHDIKEAIYLADRVVVMSSRPGRVREVITVDLPRPRAIGIKRESKFLEYEEQISTLLERSAQ